jgi:sugar phosphate isomerase/epimerase
MRPVTLCSLQWTDLDIEEMCRKAKAFGYDGLELACCGNHVEVNIANELYCEQKRSLLKKYDLKIFAIATHLVSQCVCDNIDERHKTIIPDYIWGDGSPEGVRQRAAKDIINTARVAKWLGIDVVNGFTGSSIWHLIYSFPPVPESLVEKGYEDFARRWMPILDEYQKLGIRYALEVHPTEIAFDIVSAERALQAVNYHPAFGFNFDPSHLGYQGIDYIQFIYHFADRIFHVHMKDVAWTGGPKEAGIFGGYLPFGDRRRYWNFRSPGHGNIDFEEIIRALNHINYQGPLSVEWEDSGMDREHGAVEALNFVRKIDFKPSKIAFDAAFEKK